MKFDKTNRNPPGAPPDRSTRSGLAFDHKKPAAYGLSFKRPLTAGVLSKSA
jgi:hypothetical protein